VLLQVAQHFYDVTYNTKALAKLLVFLRGVLTSKTNRKVYVIKAQKSKKHFDMK